MSLKSPKHIWFRENVDIARIGALRVNGRLPESAKRKKRGTLRTRALQ
jgi:hypothetical protein